MSIGAEGTRMGRKLLALIGFVAVAAGMAGVASAQGSHETGQVGVSASPPVSAVSFSVDGVDSPTSEAGVGQYSAPDWWPLRGSNLIGCTRNSSDRVGGPVICEGSYHPVWAIDVEGPEGQDVYATGAGQAFRHTDPGCTGYGNYITVNHNGRWSLYAHLSSFSVADGAWVDQNTVIGKVGHTGNTSDCSYNHLHYEESTTGAWWTGAVDPGPFKACVSNQVTTYPNAFGTTTWNGLRGHTYTASSSGTSCGSPSVDTSVNIRSGSFEAGASGWTARSGGGTTNMVRYTNQPAHDGRALLATNTTAGGSIFTDSAVSMAAGDSIVVTAWVRAQGSGTARGSFCAWGLGQTANQQVCDAYSVGSEYEQVQVVLNPTGAHDTLRVELYPKAGGGTTFIDTVSGRRR